MSLIWSHDVLKLRDHMVIVANTVAVLSGALLLLRFFILNNDSEIVADFHVYYHSSAWVVEHGWLYVDFPSEYPLFANLWFAIPRGLIAPFDGALRAYSMVYVTIATACYGAFLYSAGMRLKPELGRVEILAILLACSSPFLVQLVVLRFDILPAILIYLCLLTLQGGRIYISAWCFGLAIAAKGYPIVYAPAYAIYVARSYGLRAAIAVSLFMIAPSFIFLIAAWKFAGFDGMLSPFLFHARRTFDVDSIYQVFTLIASHDLVERLKDDVVQIGTAGLAILGAIWVRTSFVQLARVMAFQTLGLILISPITSPQFLIWMLPFLFFMSHSGLAVLFCAFALFSNFWTIREFDVPHFADRAFWIANCLAKLGLFVKSVSVASPVARRSGA